ncbi:MAG: MMPL family transporter [Caulobacteraceae bacterium]|nr:MMPL family transporter [Caulobacteraceae bacterium]
MAASASPSPISRLVAFCVRRAWLVILLSLILAIGAGVYAAGHFKMTTDTEQLISDKLPWRQDGIAFAKAFPEQSDNIIAVVDGQTPELAERGAAVLADRLARRGGLIRGVNRPDGGAFWDREGLLFLSQAKVQSTLDQLITAQPFLGPLASDPSLRGAMTTLQTMLTGVQTGSAKLSDVDKPVKALGEALRNAADGKPAFFSWQALFSGADGAPTRKFVIINPKLDYTALEPGAAASEAVRQTAREAGLDPAHGVTVRLTGPVPLSDEEFASLSDRAVPMLSLMLLAVLAMLWLAVRSSRVTAAIMGTTLIGLLITAGLGLAVVGRFNLISVAFIPLFVGLGVDFGIQFAVKYRAESRLLPDQCDALVAAGRDVGGSLALAAAAIAAGFFAFLPTHYVGVSELGVIAGMGMVVAFLLNVTLLPALLRVLKPKVESARGGLHFLEPLDGVMHRRRRLVLILNGAVALACLALMPLLRFDANPLDLKNPRSESMATLNELMKDPDRSPNTADVLAPSLAAADAIAAKLNKLPEVAHAVTLSSYVPDDQPAKLAAVADASLLLDTTINPFEVQPPPSDAELAASLTQTAVALRAAAVTDKGAPGQDALRLATVLERLAKGAPERRAAAQTTIAQPLATLFSQLRAMLQAQPLTLASLPPEMVRQWTATDGRARVQVFPKGGAVSDADLKRFAKAVRGVAPQASGGPVSIVEAGRTIVQAFLQAGIWSLIVITALLFLALRRFIDVVYTVLPVMLTGVLTLGTCVIIGQPINFANIIALPLLFGIGVAFHIYLVIAWRAGETHFLTSSLTRAVLFSALTTGMAFGALWVSSHPGTASMGKLLMISLAYTLATALFFGPALMGPPPKR